MKYCEEFAALLDPYVDGELSGEEAARVRAHLEGCPGCQAYADGALAIRAAFPEIGETAVPAGFAQGVMAAVRAEEARGRTRKNRRWRQILLPLAACFAVAVVLRTIPGVGNQGAFRPDSNPAPAEAENNAVPAGDSGAGQYSPAGIAPQMAEAPEALPENDVQLRIASGDSSSETTASAAADAPSALFSAFPEEEDESGTAAVSGKRMPDYEARVIRLTADQAGELLSDRTGDVGEDGVRRYQLAREEFDALLAALAERNIVPEEETAPETENLPAGYDLVYVTEE